MTDAKRLLAEANPPPPWIRPWAALNVHGIGEDEVLQKQVNIDLAVYAVNHLPDYLAAVEALEIVLPWVAPPHGGLTYSAHEKALAVLARLRDEVPA